MIFNSALSPTQGTRIRRFRDRTIEVNMGERVLVEIGLKPLFKLTIDAREAPLHVGRIPIGYDRRIVFVSGGDFEGDRVSGSVLPGGGDFLTMRPDGAMHLDVRLVLRTKEDELIYLTYQGRRHGSPEILERYRQSLPVSFEEDYFRTQVQFETASPQLSWLNDLLAIGAGYRTAKGPVYEIFEIL